MGVAAVKSEQAETRAQRRKHAKSHGMEYEVLRRGSSSGKSGQCDGVVLWEETDSISIGDVHHSSSGLLPCWL